MNHIYMCSIYEIHQIVLIQRDIWYYLFESLIDFVFYFIFSMAFIAFRNEIYYHISRYINIDYNILKRLKIF